MKPITTTNYYRLTIQNFGEYYEFGDSMAETIATVRRDFQESAERAGVTPQPLAGIRIRRSVYGEWKRELAHNGGIIL